VLSGIKGVYEVVWAYPNQTWKVYDPNDKAGSTLTSMQAGMGYWIKMTSAKTLDLSGSAPPLSLSIGSGWNLVGYNGTSCAAPSAALSGLTGLQVVWGYPSQGWQFYDPANSSGSGLTQLCPGAGYWIDVSQAGTWTLPASGSVSGTAAFGTAIAHAPVTLVDSTGKTAGGTTGADGSFSISSAGLTPPFMLKVVGSSTLYSVSADSNTTTTINVTPITDMIIRSWYTMQGASVGTAFTNPASNPPPTPTQVGVISGVVAQGIGFQAWLQNAGVSTVINPISTPFTANGAGVDAVLGQISATVNANGTISVGVNGGGATTSSTITPASNTVGVSTTETVAGIGTSSPLVISTVVPTTTAGATAVAGITTTLTNFINTINQKGASLQASDIAPYYDPNLLQDGMSASQFENQNTGSDSPAAGGVSLSLAGLQINSLDTTNNVANIAFSVSETINGLTSTGSGATWVFRLINGAWLISGNNQIAGAAVEPGASDAGGSYSKGFSFIVDDPQTNNVKSVAVSGPGLTGNVTVPVICDTSGLLLANTPCSGNGVGDNRQFELDLSGSWPPLGSVYTFTLTDNSNNTHTYTSTVVAEYGFNASGVAVPADYPSFTLTSPAGLTLAQILGGVTVHGSVFVPVWDSNVHPTFSYDLGGTNIKGTWDSGVALAGQPNNFTIVIPAATIQSSTGTCPGPTCTYSITFPGKSGTIMGTVTEALFTAYANYSSPAQDNTDEDACGTSYSTSPIQ
jgi:hypothetical protein